MGEFANRNGQRIKIGTCESMYYLRADQRHLVSGGDLGSSPERDYWPNVWFRFPFPDEDAIEPGHFEDHDRGVRIPGWTLPADFEGHGSIQFHAEPGYLLSIPCPESLTETLRLFEIAEDATARAEHPVRIFRNGWHGGAMLRQQRIFEDRLISVVSCGSCGAAWRLETIEDARPVIDAFRDEAAREEWRRSSSDWDEAEGRWGGSLNYGNEPVHGEAARANLRAIADRIEAGYIVGAPLGVPA